jgi:hypothetical protein
MTTRQPMLVRLHWWAIRQASRRDRPGYPVAAAAFDVLAGVFARLAWRSGDWMALVVPVRRPRRQM